VKAIIVPQMNSLVFKTMRSQYGSGFDARNDYVVIDGDRVVGRIFLSPASPPDRNWMWTITARDYPRSIHSRGYSETREQAMAEFKARWLSDSAAATFQDGTVKPIAGNDAPNRI
jgi:hypothetical protein